MTHAPLPLTRRRLLTLTGATIATASLVPQISFAAGPKGRPLVVILLRGGLDSQALFPLYTDPNYRSLRGPLTLGPPGSYGGILDLDGSLGLHPAAEPLLPYWQAGNMAVASAVASPYRGQSHQEAQVVLESGLQNYEASNAAGGWLNRALAASGAGDGSIRAISLGTKIPLILSGTAQTEPWLPSGLAPNRAGYLERIATLYAKDPILSEALTTGIRARALRHAMMGTDHVAADTTGIAAQNLSIATELTGRAIAAEDGPTVAVIECGGWDSHLQQGGLEGSTARALAGLANGLTALADGLGPVWKDSMILAIGEFGRSAQSNDQGGTDHGIGGMALLLGGALKKSQRLGDLPKLKAGGLDPTLDSRALFKGILAEHWGLTRSVLDKRVFPDSSNIAPISGL
ncbi:MAG: DUF1501 domain-containing protein [Alphaproteobacteria bacterium]|nr:DUF1501 domain-containing protein [Alphaproteobacteria bacterium]